VLFIKTAMNKYLLRGLIGLVLGLVLGLYGAYLKGPENELYKVVLSAGVIIFGIGFLTVVYSLMRKIDRQSLLEHRKTRKRKP